MTPQLFLESRYTPKKYSGHEEQAEGTLLFESPRVNLLLRGIAKKQTLQAGIAYRPK